MESQIPNPNVNRSSMYPQINDTNHESTLRQSSSSRPSMYPSIDMDDLVVNLFPQNYATAPVNNANYPSAPSAPPAQTESVDEAILRIPGAMLHLIDNQYSVELATGDLSIVCIRQGDNTVAVVACVAGDIQWPLTKDVAAVKLDESHYFFSFCAPNVPDSSDEEDEKGKLKSKLKSKSKKLSKESSKKLENEVLSYGLTIVSKGQEHLLIELDKVLEDCSSFSIQKVLPEQKVNSEVLDGAVAAAREVSPADLKSESKKEVMEERCGAYWTTLAPNVEEYSGTAGKLIAAGSGHLIKGILWCGDVTVDRLKWGNKVLEKRMTPGAEKTEVSPEVLKRIKRVKRVTKMTEKVAAGLLTGVVKVSGLVAGSVVNSKAAQKFFSYIPGEVLLASLDGFSKVCDAVEIAGKNVMSTSSTVTTDLVSKRYGEEAAKATNEGLDAAGHAIGTAWTVFKIRQALNPKSVLKPTALAKAAAKTAAAAHAVAEKKTKNKSSK